MFSATESITFIVFRSPGERPGVFAAANPGAVHKPAARPLAGDRRAGERAGAGEERLGHPTPAPQPAAEHQDEARA